MVGKRSGAEPAIEGLGTQGSAPGTLGEDKAMVVSESSIWADEVQILTNLPVPESLGRFTGFLGMHRAAQGNQKQNRSEIKIKSRERLNNPSLAVGSNL